jgi:hypothetical protein
LRIKSLHRSVWMNCYIFPLVLQHMGWTKYKINYMVSVTKQSYVKDVNYIKQSLCRYLIMNVLYRLNIKQLSNADVEYCGNGFLRLSKV